jgi:hypothetical protein
MEGFMQSAVEMGSGTMIYNTRFHKDRFSHLKVDKGETLIAQ